MKKVFIGYFAELLIVIFGVSIAFYLNQKATDRAEQKIHIKYLKELQSDLAHDLSLLNQNIEFNERKLEGIMEVIPYFKDPDQYLKQIIEASTQLGNYNFFEPKDFTYQSLLASGDFKKIENPNTKRNLIALYSRYDVIDNLQKNFIDALDQNYFPYLLHNFDYTSYQVINPDYHKSPVIRNVLAFSANEISNHLAFYQSTAKMVNKLDSLIQVDLELQ